MDDILEQAIRSGQSTPSDLLDRWMAIRQKVRPGSIAIVGDVMLDRFVSGHAERVSPEAAALVLTKESEVAALGGAGNVAANVAALGGVPCLITVLGDDLPSRELALLCRESGLSTDGLLTSPERQTTVKTRYLAQSTHLLRVDSERREPLSPRDARRMRATLDNALRQGGTLVLSDYAKGMLVGDTAQMILQAARAAGMHTIVDPKQGDWSVYRGADIVAPNLRELAIASDRSLDAFASKATMIDAARHLVTRYELGAVVVTMGGEGLAVVSNGGGARIIPTICHEAADVTGAGDTVIATIAVALAGGETLDIGAGLANYAAGCAVSASGTVAVTHQEVTAALESHRSADRIPTDETLHALATAWKSAGLRIGFTNGCFDILHPGHLSVLEQAASACDRLVVGLNSDASVRRLKGPRRPILDQSARAQTLAALAHVDAVAIFEEDTPIDLIRAIRPDLLVKGGDYRATDIVGADLVTNAGGRVMIVKLVNGISTTDIEAHVIERARGIFHQTTTKQSESA